MLRAITCIVIGFCSLFSVTACRPHKEEEVEFQVDYNNMTYRYVEGHYCAGALSDGVLIILWRCKLTVFPLSN